MRKSFAAAAAALGLILAFTTAADAAQRGGFRGGGFRGEGFRGEGFRGDGFRGGFRGGVFIGPGFGYYDPFWWPGYYPWAYPWGYPYSPPEVIGQYALPSGYPPPASAPPPPPQVWYRCGNPEGYFPYVQNCMTGWEQVPVTPSGAPPGAPPPPAR